MPSNAPKAPHAQARIVLWASAVLTASRVLAYLVHCGDLLAVVEESVAKGVLCSAAALFPGDELEALHHICHHLMLQAAVLSLCVLPAHDVAGCWASPSCRQKSLVTTLVDSKSADIYHSWGQHTEPRNGGQGTGQLPCCTIGLRICLVVTAMATVPGFLAGMLVCYSGDRLPSHTQSQSHESPIFGGLHGVLPRKQTTNSSNLDTVLHEEAAQASLTALHACMKVSFWLGSHLMTTMSMLSWRVGSPGTVKPCTRLTCRSSCLRSCTLRLCVLVLYLVRGVKRVPFKQTPLRRIESRTSCGRWVLGLPCGSLPETPGNLCTKLLVTIKSSSTTAAGL